MADGDVYTLNTHTERQEDRREPLRLRRRTADRTATNTSAEGLRNTGLAEEVSTLGDDGVLRKLLADGADDAGVGEVEGVLLGDAHALFAELVFPRCVLAASGPTEVDASGLGDLSRGKESMLEQHTALFHGSAREKARAVAESAAVADTERVETELATRVDVGDDGAVVQGDLVTKLEEGGVSIKHLEEDENRLTVTRSGSVINPALPPGKMAQFFPIFAPSARKYQTM
jgi:hypothetical protein